MRLQIEPDLDGGQLYVSKRKPLTEARKELIQKVQTPYFVFLDDDIRYRRGLIPELIKWIHVSKKIGAVQGRTIPYGLGEKWDKALRSPARDPEILTARDHKRFMTSNAVIKTELVRDWNPPPSYSGCEDWDLTNHIHKKGHCAVIISLNVEHYRDWKKVRSNSQWFSKAYISIFGKRQAVKHLMKVTGALGKYLLRLPLEPRKSAYVIYSNLFLMKGLLSNLI